MLSPRLRSACWNLTADPGVPHWQHCSFEDAHWLCCNKLERISMLVACCMPKDQAQPLCGGADVSNGGLAIKMDGRSFDLCSRILGQ